MDARELAKKLGSLVQLDIDATFAYEEALREIDAVEVKQRLLQFLDDHKRHIEDLSTAIREAGQSPPSFSRDIKGFLLQGFTSLRSISGTEGALKAMRSNEKLTNRTYEEARTWDLPPTVLRLVESNYADEVRHLSYIEETLATCTRER